jgi:hypothetical protein
MQYLENFLNTFFLCLPEQSTKKPSWLVLFNSKRPTYARCLIFCSHGSVSRHLRAFQPPTGRWLQGKGGFVCCSGRRVACIPILRSQPTPATAGKLMLPLQEKISPDLQLLALNLHRRWRCDNALFTGSIRDRFNHPLPAGMASSVNSPSCATAFVNLHSPVIAVGRNCEHNRYRGRDHHTAQHSNEK